jgi:hypothetical protein
MFNKNMNSYFERPHQLANSCMVRVKSHNDHLAAKYKSIKSPEQVNRTLRMSTTRRESSDHTSATPTPTLRLRKTIDSDSSTDSDTAWRPSALARKQSFRKNQKVVEYYNNKTVELKKSSLFNDSAYATLSNSSTNATIRTSHTKPPRSKTVEPKNAHYYYNHIYNQASKDSTNQVNPINEESPRVPERLSTTDESVDLFNMNTKDLANYIDELRTNFRNTHLPQYQTPHQVYSQQTYENQPQPDKKISNPIDVDEFIKFTQSYEIIDNGIESDSTGTGLFLRTPRPLQSPPDLQQINKTIQNYCQIRRDQACSRLDRR